MNVTPRYKKDTPFFENFAAMVIGAFALCAGPIVAALGWIGG